MKNEFNIENRIIVITGGSGTLGGALADHLIEQGSRVVIIGSREESVANKMSAMSSYGDRVLGIAVDVTNEEEVVKAKAKILDHWGRIDVLINAAGGNVPGATVPPGKSIFDVSIPDLQKVMDLNLMGSIIPSLVFGKVMADQNSGSIINVSSMAASQALTRVFGYSIAKAGVDMLTKWMSMELSLQCDGKVRVNAIAPGFFIGNQNRRLLTNEDGTYTERGQTIISNTPMKRFGHIDELNGLVHYLCSDASSFVTGTVIPVDGGFSSFSGV